MNIHDFIQNINISGLFFWLTEKTICDIMHLSPLKLKLHKELEK